jgi:agmatinase
MIYTDAELSYDNEYAIKQIEEGHYALLSRDPATDAAKPGPSLKGKTLPRVVRLRVPSLHASC